ncbi:MAG: YqhA family protein [Acidimicrobiales bacterium]
MTSNHRPLRRRRSVGDVRFLAHVAVAGLCASTVTTFGIAIGKTVRLVDKAMRHGAGDELVIVSVLEAIDTHLLAVVQLIVAIGLYELFIGDLRVPDWLEARSLEDLKKPIVDVLVVFVAIKGIERFVVEDEPLDALAAVGAAAVLIAALTLFRTLTGVRKRTG